MNKYVFMKNFLLWVLIYLLASCAPIPYKALSPSCAPPIDHVIRGIQNKQWAYAEKKLHRVLGSLCRTKYERSEVYLLLGHVHRGQKRYVESIDAYQKMIDISATKSEREVEAIYFAARLSYRIQDYKRAIKLLRKRKRFADDVDPDSQFLLARSYHAVDKKYIARSIMKKLVEQSDSSVPPEDWLSLLWVLHIKTEDKKAAIIVVKQLIEHYPDDKYISWFEATCQEDASLEGC